MKIKDLMNLDISRLTAKEIGSIGHYAQVQVNKQARRWEKQEFKSPAYYALKKSGGDISFAGKTLNQKKGELARAIRFLADPTRTQKGWKETKQEIGEEVKKRFDLDITPENFDSVWTAYEKAKELNSNVGLEDYKYNVIQSLNDMLDETPESNIDELAVTIAERLDDLIQERESELEEERESISRKFK